MEKCLQDFRPGSKNRRISRMNGKAFLLAGIAAGVYGGEVFNSAENIQLYVSPNRSLYFDFGNRVK